MADLMSVTPQLEDKNQHSNTLYYKWTYTYHSPCRRLSSLVGALCALRVGLSAVQPARRHHRQGKGKGKDARSHAPALPNRGSTAPGMPCAPPALVGAAGLAGRAANREWGPCPGPRPPPARRRERLKGLRDTVLLRAQPRPAETPQVRREREFRCLRCCRGQAGVPAAQAAPDAAAMGHASAWAPGLRGVGGVRRCSPLRVGAISVFSPSRRSANAKLPCSTWCKSVPIYVHFTPSRVSLSTRLSRGRRRYGKCSWGSTVITSVSWQRLCHSGLWCMCKTRNRHHARGSMQVVWLLLQLATRRARNCPNFDFLPG